VSGRNPVEKSLAAPLKIILKRIFIIVFLWAMLTGGAVVVCSSGDGNLFLPGRNRPPVAEDSFLQTDVETSIRSTMQASDPDGDDLTYRITSGPDTGSLTDINADTGRFTYVPAAAGTDRFTFKANDGRLDSNTGTVSILVTSAAVGAQIVGLKSVLPDMSHTGGLIVLWGAPSGLVERMDSPGAGPLQRLIDGVDQLVADPWQAGRLLALMKDGRLLTSLDNGLEWQPEGWLKQPGGVGGLAYAGNRVLIAITATDCGTETTQGLFVPVEGAPSPIDVELACGHDPVLGSLDGAWVVRHGWLHSAGDDAKLLGPDIAAVATDPWQQKRLAAVTRDDSGLYLMRISEDGGQTWRRTNRAELPRGDIGQLVFDPGNDGAMLVSVWSGDGTTSVYSSRSEQAPWHLVGSLGDGQAKMVCYTSGTIGLLSEDGTRLRRFGDRPDEG
jgi:hypothetical protein